MPPDAPVCELMHKQIEEIGKSLKTVADRMPSQEAWADMRTDMRQIKESIYGNGRRGLLTRVSNLEVVTKLNAKKDASAQPPSRESEVALEAQKAKTELFKIAIGKVSGLILKLGVIYLCFRFGYIDLIKPWLGAPAAAAPTQQEPAAQDAVTPISSKN